MHQELRKKMSKIKQPSIEVHAHWVGLPEPILMGILYATNSRGKEIFSFEYDNDWLKRNQAHTLDPSLQLYSGKQYVSNGKENYNFTITLWISSYAAIKK